MSNITGEAGSSAILRAITAIGESLHMSTTAEGVETEEQLEKVRSEGCTEMQGYLFSPPVSADNLHKFFEKTPEIVQVAG